MYHYSPALPMAMLFFVNAEKELLVTDSQEVRRGVHGSKYTFQGLNTGNYKYCRGVMNAMRNSKVTGYSKGL